MTYKVLDLGGEVVDAVRITEGVVLTTKDSYNLSYVQVT